MDTSMQTIEVIARAVIIEDNKILLCKRKDRDYYFLPGGHVEFGERASNALMREIKEELGVDTDSTESIDVLENIFIQDGESRHEINLIFSVKLASRVGGSAEDRIEFRFAARTELSRMNLLPETLADLLLNYQS